MTTLPRRIMRGMGIGLALGIVCSGYLLGTSDRYARQARILDNADNYADNYACIFSYVDSFMFEAVAIASPMIGLIGGGAAVVTWDGSKKVIKLLRGAPRFVRMGIIGTPLGIGAVGIAYVYGNKE